MRHFFNVNDFHRLSYKSLKRVVHQMIQLITSLVSLELVSTHHSWLETKWRCTVNHTRMELKDIAGNLMGKM